jgi:hypothetical protein
MARLLRLLLHGAGEDEGSRKGQCRRVTLPVGLQFRALRYKAVTRQVIEERFCHLTVRAVVDANKEGRASSFPRQVSSEAKGE